MHSKIELGTWQQRVDLGHEQHFLKSFFISSITVCVYRLFPVPMTATFCLLQECHLQFAFPSCIHTVKINRQQKYYNGAVHLVKSLLVPTFLES